ncbi:NADH-quinone oxidoreductase subunit J [Candidatus Trichorickettsia mobilis]|uniref:NADH-quinone oxidoreductase subunit J n=1 Tax=Candidatus Trichorickettsia mobilis TaxID=1346319 RepID=UPI00292FFFB4|nr:NADH-quinone oxidoreductase subunit J [Candidatus Trichorickettsia mobilis]
MIFFYLFASLIIISSICVVTSRNPVIAVLWLIFAFCNGSGLMILLGAEFLAMMLIVIYVGAVAVLFLFVVMMLDIKFAEVQGELKKNLSIASIIAVIMFADLILIILLGTKSINISNVAYTTPTNISNTLAIGKILYTDFVLPFQAAGLILFVAMVACIALTLRPSTTVKRQNIHQQLKRNKDSGMNVTKLGVKQGVQEIQYD